MPVTVFTEKTTLGDLIRYEHDQQYTRESAKIFNRSLVAITLANPMGYPLKADGANDFAFAKATEEANVIGFLLSTKKVDALAVNGSIKAAVLLRGPAIVAQEFLPATDYAAAAFTIATIVTAAAAFNPPVLIRPEEDVTSTQTT